MRKSAWFLAASLTAFIITMLAGVVYAYHGISFTEPLSAQPVQAASLSTQQPDPTQAQAPVSAPPLGEQSANLSPQQAAAIAAKSLHRTDLYSVQLSVINGLNLYKVAFVSSDIVFVSMDGQVVLTVPAPVAAVTAVPTLPSLTSNLPPSSGGGGGGGHHHPGGGGGGGGGNDGGGDH
jgi:uncharacterized membrane protein YgcG